MKIPFQSAILNPAARGRSGGASGQAIAPPDPSSSWKLMFRQAAGFTAKRQFPEADAVYRTIAAQASREPQSLPAIGMEMIRHRRFADAVDLLGAALKRDSRSAELHNALGFALTGLGRLDQAVGRYRMAIQRKPDFAEAHSNLAYALQQLRLYAEALQHGDKAIALRPDYPEAHNNRGNSLQALGRRQDALFAYAAALVSNSAYVEARRNLAVVLVGLGYVDFDEDDPAWPPSLMVDVDTWLAVGWLYLQADNARSALRVYERVLQRDQGREQAVFGLGRAHAMLHRFDEAARLFEGMLERGVQSGEVLSQLAGLPPSVVRVDLLAEIDKRDTGKAAGGLYAYSRSVVLDRAGRHAEAWAVLEPANAKHWALMREKRRLGEEQEQQALERLRSGPVQLAMQGGSTGSSLFILGASRSGKTTIEGLAGQLDDVERGYENSLVEDSWHFARNQHGLAEDAVREGLPEACWASFRETYRAAIARAAGSRAFFTTTNPGHIRIAEFLVAVLPGVRLVLVKRDVEDTVLRMLMKSYHRGNAYAYDVDAARAHVVWYHRMIDELASKYPDITRVLSYEDVLDSPGASLATIAGLCRLPLRHGSLPLLHDDRNCARPYAEYLRSGAGG